MTTIRIAGVSGKTRHAALLIAVCALLWTFSSMTLAAEPIRIGVIAPQALHNGPSFVHGAELAVKEINANGGIGGRPIKLFEYDDKVSSSKGVLAFQRAVQSDHVVAVVGVFISEIALALEPWSTRLKTPLIITGAASTKITERVHNDYDKYKYVFQQFLNSKYMARATCSFAHDVLVGDLHYKTAAIFSEDAAWTKPLDAEYSRCLPKAGLKIVDRIRFDVDTSAFSPIYNRIRAHHPDVIINAIAHTGVKPVVQWQQQQVPDLMAGPNGQGSSAEFWDATNGAAQGLIVGGTISANGAALTKKTPKFYHDYVSAYGRVPAFSAYTTYDSIYTLKDAMERAGSTDADKLTAALEKTDREGVSGQIKFQSRKQPFTHGLVYVPHVTSGVYFQWQNGKQVVIWPKRVAQGSIVFPDFVPKP